MTFLQKCPSAVFEPEPVEEQVNIEHPDLVEQLQKQLEENLSVKSTPADEEKAGEANMEKTGEKEVATAEVVQEIGGQGKFWATHLEYNIDDLIADL